MATFGVDPSDPSTFPFCNGDVTGGSETELQAAVVGSADDVDLPITIRESSYYSNALRRIASGDTPSRTIRELDEYLEQDGTAVWENSWVRFPLRLVGPFAQLILDNDLQADKSDPDRGRRSDVDQFLFDKDGERWLRVPISYLVKLSLADSCDDRQLLPETIRKTAIHVLSCFLNDNTSPETLSFHVVRVDEEGGNGRAIANETAKRYLLTQALLAYANTKFELQERGQEALIFFSPQPPQRQRLLNRMIPDSFYRELFMSPCLSGWDLGEEKQRYMSLCHEVLSRSHINVVDKLREAGIITHNLVVLPSTSSTSLANNGVHVSLGSRKWTALRASGAMTTEDEKAIGDLSIKIFEHFLPLFVGSYSASPFRLDFEDLHPETALGFLPHELDYTHLRMLWRRWRRKTKNRFFGHAFQPFGPKHLDRTLARLFRLRGDFVPDFRLVDYPVALLSTPNHAAFDGTVGNADRLRRDLDHHGVFDRRMSLYLPYKLREFDSMGFFGFEARHFSLFDSLQDDFGESVDLQLLCTQLAMQYIADGRFDHSSIPDDPEVESERRQFFFARAIGVPTIYVRMDSPNQLLGRIIERVEGVRPSRRYVGYLRVPMQRYVEGLVTLLREDAAAWIEHQGLESTVDRLEKRIRDPKKHAVAERLTGDVVEKLNGRDPLRVRAKDFNRAAEEFYRVELRKRHLEESLDIARAEVVELLGEDGAPVQPTRTRDDQPANSSGHTPSGDDSAMATALESITGNESTTDFFDRLRVDIVNGTGAIDDLRRFIRLLLLLEAYAGDRP